MAEDSKQLVRVVDDRLAAATSLEEIERLVRVREQLLSQTDTLQVIERRIATSSDPREMVLTTEIRGELMRQNEERAENAHRRRLEVIEVTGKSALSFATLVAGVWLISAGFAYAGLLIIGASVYNLAPKYVMAALKQLRGNNKDEN